MIYDKDTVCLPRQGIPFCLRPLYLPELRRFRAKSWDTFGTIEDRDETQNKEQQGIQVPEASGVFVRECVSLERHKSNRNAQEN